MHKRHASVAVVIAAIGLCSCAMSRANHLPAPVTVPFELRGDLVLVHVAVNGHDAVLVLDSGSGALVLDSAFADASGFKVNRGARAMANGRTPVRLGTSDSVSVRGAVLTNVMTVAVDFTPVQRRVGYDVRGTIGADLFKHFVVTVDYGRRSVTLADPGAFSYSGRGAEVPIRLENNLPVVTASIVTRHSGTLPANLHLDLGSTRYAVRLSRRFLAAHPIDSDTTSVAVELGAGVGGSDQGLLMRLPKLVIGSLSIDRPSTALSVTTTGPFGDDAVSDGTIGEPVFERTRLIFDYPHSRVIIEPVGRLDLPDSVDASGLQLVHPDSSATRWSIVSVVAGSAADSAGIEAGSELLAVDGRPVADMAPEQLFAALRRTGVACTLTVLQDGPRTLTVMLRSIV